MAKLTYQPLPHDTDETTVAGITFKAFEPVELNDDLQKELIAKLGENPWFTTGEVDQDRYDQWKALRNARAVAAQHHDHAEAIEKNPELAATNAPAAHAEADRIVSDANAQAEKITAQAQADANTAVTSAHTLAAQITSEAQVEADARLDGAKTQAEQIVGDARAEAAAIIAKAKADTAPKPDAGNGEPSKTVN